MGNWSHSERFDLSEANVAEKADRNCIEIVFEKNDTVGVDNRE